MLKTETTKAGLEYDGKGLLTVTLFEDAEIHLKDALEIREAAFSLHKGKPHVTLVFTGQRTSSTEETRKFSSQNPAPGKIAEGIVINSLPVRLMGNFYLKFYKPLTPTRLFESKEDALNWLFKKLKENDIKSSSGSQLDG